MFMFVAITIFLLPGLMLCFLWFNVIKLAMSAALSLMTDVYNICCIFCSICLYCLNCTKFGQLILRKIFKFVTIRCLIFRLKCTKFDFSCGSTLDPAGGAYSTPQTSSWWGGRWLPISQEPTPTCLLPPFIMIHAILCVQFPCRTVFFDYLSPSFLWFPLRLAPSTSYSIHFFTQSLSFYSTCPYHRNLFCCSTEIMSSNPSLSLNRLLGTLSCSLTPHIHLTILLSAC